MKLTKLRNKQSTSNTFIISDFEIESIDKIWVRTNRIHNFKKCYDIVLNSEYMFMETRSFKLESHEIIVYEIEFEKLEDLIELIPEEFL